jgi:LemA protein
MRKILIAVVAIILLAWIGLGLTGFNTVVDRDEEVMAAWSEVENQYQRRADLIPNLVETVKGAKDFEQETLTAVTEARAGVAGVKVDASLLEDPARFKEWEQAQAKLSGALSRLLVVAERYPDLKATAAYRDLMVQLEGTENRIAVARKRYIEAVSAFNKQVRRFPSSIGASLRGLDARPTFEATTPNADQAPKVEF